MSSLSNVTQSELLRMATELRRQLRRMPLLEEETFAALECLHPLLKKEQLSEQEQALFSQHMQHATTLLKRCTELQQKILNLTFRISNTTIERTLLFLQETERLRPK